MLALHNCQCSVFAPVLFSELNLRVLVRVMCRVESNGLLSGFRFCLYSCDRVAVCVAQFVIWVRRFGSFLVLELLCFICLLTVMFFNRVLGELLSQSALFLGCFRLNRVCGVSSAESHCLEFSGFRVAGLSYDFGRVLPALSLDNQFYRVHCRVAELGLF